MIFPFFFAAPAVIWQFIFIYIPLIILFFNSFLDFNSNLLFSFSVYASVLNYLYFRVILNSFVLAFITSIICLIVGYPVAYFISMKVRKYKTLFLFSLIIPSWTSFIVQVYAWFFLLKKGGLFSFLLKKIGLISDSTHLLNNYFAIELGMVYCFLPFMILPIYTILEKMDNSLIEASSDLGANRFETFKRVILPFSMSGIKAGFLLVFIPAFGEFAVPDLLGGGKKIYWGSVIVDKFLVSRNWKAGAALTIVGILSLILIMIFFFLLFRFLNKKAENI